MKRHIWSAICCLLPASSPLMAQDDYGSTNDSDGGAREFHLNPGNMMNRMPNPMPGFFGSSNRRYNGYPQERYAPPPAYPPAYGYPTYQPPAGYGYGYPYPQTAPTQVAPTPAPLPKLESARIEPAPAAPSYQPPEHTQGYRFRPLEQEAAANPMKEHSIVAEPIPAPAALAPIEYPTFTPTPEPIAPVTYPETPEKRVPVAKSAPEIITHEGQTLKFRPRDLQGYSSEQAE